MGQHFSIKQSEMKRTGALVFARRLLSFQRLGLTSSALFSGISALEFFFGCFVFLLCGFWWRDPNHFANYQGINPILIKKTKERPDS